MDQTISTNRDAGYLYHLGDRWEAGIALTGTEIKSVRAAKVNLKDGWVDVSGSILLLMDVQITEYSHGNVMNHEPKRPRALLLNLNEIKRIRKAVQVEGFTVVPTKMYFKGRRVKIEIAIAKGKKLHDKRASEKEKASRRDLRRD